MDIIRDTRPQKKRKRLLWSIAGICLLAMTLFVPRLLPTAVPPVDAATVWRDTVEYGTMIRQVRESHPDMKVVFISGYTEDSFRKRLDEDTGEILFLPKPFTLQQLAGVVKEVMANGAG